MVDFSRRRRRGEGGGLANETKRERERGGGASHLRCKRAQMRSERPRPLATAVYGPRRKELARSYLDPGDLPSFEKTVSSAWQLQPSEAVYLPSENFFSVLLTRFRPRTRETAFAGTLLSCVIGSVSWAQKQTSLHSHLD